ncbi:Lrp/AsnC family transcriptional regulator [Saccharothrix variisporea]|uniref:AsnC family transcriptional regulator n=1 Tax=Saccharothrix variisporea TaxID=543527 RepID=A0A495XDV9_9PSEU|nr:Lrp/AsnC family transcriptional regulator [Saccharothrix variisporea]RKT71315.1 AsnC family transcriptional regulator [Saccharothrix variisporea]
MSLQLALVDQRVLSALQVDGRASPGRIAEVLDVSPRTVARSLTRLAPHARVVRVPNPEHGLRGATLLRVRVLRGRVEVIADSLARRPEVLFIDVLSGGDEISAVVLGGVPALPTNAITSVQALSVLHVFSDAADWRSGLLTPEETTALTPPAPTADHTPDDLDQALLTLLTTDARTGPGALATATGTPESTVRRRVDRLAASGHLRTYAIADPRLFGLTVDANVWMTVPPGHLDALGRRLARHPSVHGTLATTGPTNLSVAVFCRDLPALYDFVTSLNDIPAAEVTVVGSAVKRAGRRG